MARARKDVDWSINKSSGGGYSYDAAQLSVLMDIRDELKVVSRKLSALECPNFVGIPSVLRRISANTSKPRKRKNRSAVR